MIKQKQEAEDERLDAEAECEMLRKRLEALDPKFKEEQRLLAQIVENFVSKSVSAE